MISPQDRRLRTRELVSLILLTLGIKFSDMTATIIYKKVSTAAWMVPFIAGIVMIIPFLCVLALVKHYKDRNFIDITYQVTGKYVGFIIGMTMFLIAFSSTVVNTRSYVDIINTMYFQDTSTVQLYIVLVGSTFFLANRGLLAIGRTAWITIPYIKGTMFLGLFFMWNKLFFGHLFPFFGNGFKAIITEGVLYSSITGDLIFFSVLFPFYQSYKSFKKASFLAFGLVIFEISIFLMFFVGIFDFPQVEFIAYPFHELIRMITFGRFITNVEALFFAFWTVASIVRFAVYLYISTATFSYTLKVKEFEPLLLPFAALTVILGLIPENPVTNVLVLRENYILSSTSVIIFIIPLTVYIVAKLRGVFKQNG